MSVYMYTYCHSVCQYIPMTHLLPSLFLTQRHTPLRTIPTTPLQTQITHIQFLLFPMLHISLSQNNPITCIQHMLISNNNCYQKEKEGRKEAGSREREGRRKKEGENGVGCIVNSLPWEQSSPGCLTFLSMSPVIQLNKDLHCFFFLSLDMPMDACRLKN